MYCILCLLSSNFLFSSRFNSYQLFLLEQTCHLCEFLFLFAFTLQAVTHLSSISKGSKKRIKGSKASLNNSATCSSSTTYFKASISVTPNFSNSIKTWQFFNSNSNNSFHTTPLRLSVKTTPHLKGLSRRPQTMLIPLRCLWICHFTVHNSHPSRLQWIVRLLSVMLISLLLRHLYSELLGILQLVRLVALNLHTEKLKKSLFGIDMLSCRRFRRVGESFCSRIRHVKF